MSPFVPVNRDGFNVLSCVFGVFPIAANNTDVWLQSFQDCIQISLSCIYNNFINVFERSDHEFALIETLHWCIFGVRPIDSGVSL